MHAGLHFRRIENELCFAAFLLHCVVALNGDLSEGILVLCEAIMEYQVINCVGHSGRDQCGDKTYKEKALQENLDSYVQSGNPGARLYPLPWSSLTRRVMMDATFRWCSSAFSQRRHPERSRFSGGAKSLP